MWLTDLERLRPALDAFNRGVQRGRNAYNLENHCRCGGFVGFAPMHRDQRVCGDCRAGDVA